MTQETDTVAALGDNTSDLVVEETAPSVPAPPAAVTQFVMMKDELFTRNEYHAAGWTDDQLVHAGKMITIAPPPPADLVKPIGMTEYKWVVLDDNDDIPPTGLFVGHNGNPFLLQTGTPLRAPVHILDVLDDAIMDAPIIDPKTRQVVGYRPRPRYTYREVPAPVDA